MPKQTKQELMDEIREYNDEAFYDNLRPLSMDELRKYLAELQEEYPDIKAELDAKKDSTTRR